MVRTLIPAVIGLIAIVSLSFYEGYKMKDRWGVAGIQAKELSERFAQVPLHIGDWEGEDLPVDEVVRKTAGAVGYVSRRYTHAISGKEVVLWLIVGHSRDITRHTPNICYPSSGFRQAGSQLRHHIEIKNIRADDGDTDDGDKGSDGNTANEKLVVFYTAKFEKEDAFSHSIERVFWTFNHPDKNQWEAPEEGARWHYGLSKSLYKLYFTSAVRSEEDTIEENAAVEFAQLMLPAIDAALFPTVAADAIGANGDVSNGDGANGDGANGDGAVSDTPTTEAEH